MIIISYDLIFWNPGKTEQAEQEESFKKTKEC